MFSNDDMFARQRTCGYHHRNAILPSSGISSLSMVCVRAAGSLYLTSALASVCSARLQTTRDVIVMGSPLYLSPTFSKTKKKAKLICWCSPYSLYAVIV